MYNYSVEWPFNVTTNNEAPNSKYMSGNIRHLINDAIQNELVNLPATVLVKIDISKLPVRQ